jgi:prophage regulatory protein
MSDLNANLEGNRILRLREVLNLVQLSKSEIYRRVAGGSFPAPVALGAGSRAVGWRLSNIVHFLNSLKEKEQVAKSANRNKNSQ